MRNNINSCDIEAIIESLQYADPWHIISILKSNPSLGIENYEVYSQLLDKLQEVGEIKEGEGWIEVGTSNILSILFSEIAQLIVELLKS